MGVLGWMQIFTPKSNSHKQAGFSLLELLVVLAIMGLMLSVISVRLIHTIESAYFNRTADAAIADVLILRAEAVLENERRLLITDTSRIEQLNDVEKKAIRRLELPKDWRSEGDPIHISHTGTCLGGEITVLNDEGRRVIYKLSPPKCIARRA